MSIVCSACNFPLSFDTKSSHYSTEWHRYNVKRKCASLPPVPQNLFESKLSQLQESAAATPASQVQKCFFCSKVFHSDAAFEAHLESNKHKALVKAHPEPNAVASVFVTPKKVNDEEEKHPGANGTAEEEEDEHEALPATSCLFCSETFETMELTIEHMQKGHSFFVPYVEYLEDLSGLMEYLGYKVGMGRVCLYCNGRGRACFPTLKAVQQHMVDKSHCKIRFEDEDEETDLLEFYNFEKQNSEETTLSKDVSFDSISALGEMVMSDGTIRGNRMNALYYKQNPKPRETRESVLIARLQLQYHQGPVLVDMPERKRNALRLAERQRLHVGIKVRIMSFSPELLEDLKLPSRLEPSYLGELCKMAVSNVLNGDATNKMYAKAAETLKVETDALRKGVEALAEVLIEAAKKNLAVQDVLEAVSTLKFSEECKEVLKMFITENQNSVRGFLQELSLKLPHYRNLNWRLDVQIASRSLRQVFEPTYLLELETIESKSVLQCDYANLKNLANELEEAMAQLKSGHCRRILRYVR